jgi:hypothetical protein
VLTGAALGILLIYLLDQAVAAELGPRRRGPIEGPSEIEISPFRSAAGRINVAPLEEIELGGVPGRRPPLRTGDDPGPAGGGGGGAPPGHCPQEVQPGRAVSAIRTAKPNLGPWRWRPIGDGWRRVVVALGGTGRSLKSRISVETTILNVRHRLEKHRIAEQILGGVNQMLSESAVKLREGTILAATLVIVPSSALTRAKPACAGGTGTSPS